MDQRMGELAAYEESLAIRRRLARIDPSNAQWRHDEACILDGIGNVYRKVGKSQEAIAAYEEGVAIWRQLAKLDPRNHHRQLTISISLKKLGDVKLEAADSVPSHPRNPRGSQPIAGEGTERVFFGVSNTDTANAQTIAQGGRRLCGRCVG